ncbi:MAG: LysM peptidoglycan-binding domain-containing protein [Sulfurospirillum cavolei]|nr:LysM peptidoglycan-binding domain-containing protein [Sulfurospirillum cavolei]
MESISKKYAISLDMLLKANHKKEALVKAGESIVIPKR